MALEKQIAAPVVTPSLQQSRRTYAAAVIDICTITLNSTRARWKTRISASVNRGRTQIFPSRCYLQPWY